MKTSHGPVRALLLDMDGTLVDTEPVWQHAEEVWLAGYGHVWQPATAKAVIGLPVPAAAAKLAAMHGFEGDPHALADELVAEFLGAVARGLNPCPGADALIRWAAEALDGRVAIASSSPNVIIEAVVTRCGWQDLVSVRVSGEEVPAGKPAPDVYLEAARRLGVPIAACAAVEDSPTGAAAAAAAGTWLFAVPNAQFFTAADFPMADRVVGGLDEVREALICSCR